MGTRRLSKHLNQDLPYLIYSGGVNMNYLAVLVCAVFYMILGVVWYSKPVFGKAWMKLTGTTEAKEVDMPKTMGIAFVASLVMAYVTAYVVGMMGATTLLDGATLGVYLWFGYVATTMINGVLWEQRPWNLYFMNSGQYLVALIVTGAFLAVW